MSWENVEVVRQGVRASPEPRKNRRLEERFFLRFPGVRLAVSRAFLALSPRSRIRRSMVRHTVRIGVEATTRRDYESAFGSFHPDVELHVPQEIVVLGSFPAVLEGREERIRLERRWRDDWGDFRYVPEELIDLGDRILMLGRMVGSGPSSGVAFDREWADVLTLSHGQVVREQVFFSAAEALETVGLSE